MEYLEELFASNTYFENKILYVIKEFEKLFINALNKKGIENEGDQELFTVLANKVKKNYPELESRIEQVIIYYGEEKDTEEKLYYMMKLYALIKEKIENN